VGTVDDALLDLEQRQGAFLAVDARTRWPGPSCWSRSSSSAGRTRAGFIPLELEEKRIGARPRSARIRRSRAELAARAAVAVGWQRMAWEDSWARRRAARALREAKRRAPPAGCAARASSTPTGSSCATEISGACATCSSATRGGCAAWWSTRATGSCPSASSWPPKSIESQPSDETVHLSLTRAEIARAPACQGLAPDRESIERRLRIAEALR
jgi:hypothetical protein